MNTVISKYVFTPLLSAFYGEFYGVNTSWYVGVTLVATVHTQAMSKLRNLSPTYVLFLAAIFYWYKLLFNAEYQFLYQRVNQAMYANEIIAIIRIVWVENCCANMLITNMIDSYTWDFQLVTGAVYIVIIKQQTLYLKCPC